MNRINIIKTVAVLTMVTLALTGTLAASDWSQFQKDEVNIGRTADSAPVVAPDDTTSWDQHTASSAWSGIDTAPVVGDGKVYVVAYNGNVYAKYLNGTHAWTNTTIGGDGNFELATPAYNDGVLYVALSKGNASTQTGIHALYTDNGTVKWSNASIGDQQTNTPVTYYDGLIFFGTVNMTSVNNSDKGYYYCYYANNGTQKWVRNNNNTGGGYYWAGAAVIGDYLVYGDDGGYLTSVYWCNKTDVDELHVGSGKIRSSIAWNVSASDSNYGHIFFTNRSGNRVTRIGFNKSTGEFNSSDWWAHDIGYTTSTPAVYKGRVYVGSSGGLYCLDESDGSEDWSFTPNGGVQSSPVISTWYDNGTNNEIYIYFTTNCASGRLYCLKDYSGNTAAREQWNYQPSENKAGYTLQGAAISGGWIFFGNDKGYLFGLSNWTRYDFNTARAIESPKKAWAFKYQVDDSPGAGDPSEEFNATEYANIRFDDNVYASNQSTANGNYAAHRFNFSIDDNEESWITKINVTWNGKGWHDTAGNNGTCLYIWNSSGSGAYEELDSDLTTGDEVTLTGERDSDISNYINSGNVTILVKQKSPQTYDDFDGIYYRSHIETDYVKLVVTP
jgi:outer membrane protein assembly factor BamB